MILIYVLNTIRYIFRLFTFSSIDEDISHAAQTDAGERITAPGPAGENTGRGRVFFYVTNQVSPKNSDTSEISKIH